MPYTLSSLLARRDTRCTNRISLRGWRFGSHGISVASCNPDGCKHNRYSMGACARIYYRPPIRLITPRTTAWYLIGGATDKSTNYWVIQTDSGANGFRSADGSTWAANIPAAYYRVLSAAPNPLTGMCLFVDYKRTQYMITQPVAGNSYIYMNGDKGAADDNSAAKSTLIDATKCWVVNQWIGAKVIITAGPGAEESKPWRDITENDGTTLTVSPAWYVSHTTATEYAIVNTDKWSVVPFDFTSATGTTNGDLGGFATDVTRNG